MTNITISAQVFEDMADRIEELEAKLFSCATDLDIYMSAHASLEAKLAKAVEALDKIKRIDNLVGVFAACERTLAELTGGKDD